LVFKNIELLLYFKPYQNEENYTSSIGTAIEQHFTIWGHGGMVGCRGDVGGWASRLGDGWKLV